MSKDDNNNATENSNQTDSPVVLENSWMIRQCILYDEEYSECTSLKGRFHQYFIHGKFIDCSQWKRDSVNCYKWESKKDIKAAKELIESEKLRRRERLLGHVKNDVWERRKEPPDDWNKPLPKYMQEAYENTYLNIKSKELKGESPVSFDMNVPSLSCTIL